LFGPLNPIQCSRYGRIKLLLLFSQTGGVYKSSGNVNVARIGQYLFKLRHWPTPL
jgi:hypothetical protein